MKHGTYYNFISEERQCCAAVWMVVFKHLSKKSESLGTLDIKNIVFHNFIFYIFNY